MSILKTQSNAEDGVFLLALNNKKWHKDFYLVLLLFKNLVKENK
jgi:hypothetical protein